MCDLPVVAMEIAGDAEAAGASKPEQYRLAGLGLVVHRATFVSVSTLRAVSSVTAMHTLCLLFHVPTMHATVAHAALAMCCGCGRRRAVSAFTLRTLAMVIACLVSQ
jgi:hypothetical protein